MSQYHTLILCISSVNKGIFLSNHNAPLKIRKLTMTYYYHGILRLHLSFISFPNKDLYSTMVQVIVKDLVGMSVQSFSVQNSFLVFPSLHNLGTFEDYRLIILQTPSVYSCDVPSLDLDRVFLTVIAQEMTCVLSSASYQVAYNSSLSHGPVMFSLIS